MLHTVKQDIDYGTPERESTEQVSLTIDGADWVQQPFAYQGKCLSRLRSDYAALPSAAKARVDQVIADTGCAALFAAA